MCAPALSLVAVGLQVASGIYQAQSQYQQGIATSNYYKYQAEQSRIEGENAVRVGAKQSELIQDTAARQGKQLKTNQAEFDASQRAAAVSAGVSGGTLEDITSSTFSKEKLDEIALRYGADVQSYQTTENAKYARWSAQNQAQQYDYSAKYAKSAAKRNSFATLLGTAASVAFTPFASFKSPVKFKATNWPYGR